MVFHNRLNELAFLNEAWESRQAQLLVVYGRRRVGKTELLREFSGSRRQVFYVATQSSGPIQLRSLARAARAGLHEEAAGVAFADWEGVFEFLAARSSRERTLVVLDEFPYLAEADPALPSILQAAWDASLRRGQIVLVLCGSSMAWMEQQLLGERSPLYGRRTGQLLVEPMNFRDAALFFPGASPQELVELFATVGGMPAYLEKLDPSLSLWDNVAHHILRKGAFLRDEVPFLLRQELREPRLYLAILTAIAEGCQRLSEIAQRALGPGSLHRAGFYLQTLQDLRLVKRDVPLTETHPHKSRKGLYRLADPFVRFWMRYVFQEASALEAGRSAQVLADRIQPGWADFVAPVFEELCRGATLNRLRLPFEPARAGSWWAAGSEIDVVAVDADEEHVFCAECKWSVKSVGTDVLDRLQTQSDALMKHFPGARLHLGLFARQGFTDSLRRRSDGLHLFTAEDLA